MIAATLAVLVVGACSSGGGGASKPRPADGSGTTSPAITTGLPPQFPLPEGAKLLGTFESEQIGRKVDLAFPQPPDVLRKTLESALRDATWRVGKVAQLGDHISTFAVGGFGYEGSVVVGPDVGGGSRVNVTVKPTRS